MLNYFKPFKISSTDVKKLKNVNPFWSKELNKRIKRLNTWLIKFRQTGLNFTIQKTEEYSGYEKLFTQIDHYKSFVNQKYTLIKSAPKILLKFQKLIDDYCSSLGIVKAIEIICQFHEDLDTKVVSNHREWFIILTNQTIDNFLNIFLKEIKPVFKDDAYINLCFENIVRSSKSIINPSIFLKNVFKYNNILYRKKKISQEEFISINASLIEMFAFMNEFCITTSVITNGLH